MNKGRHLFLLLGVVFYCTTISYAQSLERLRGIYASSQEALLSSDEGARDQSSSGFDQSSPDNSHVSPPIIVPPPKRTQPINPNPIIGDEKNQSKSEPKNPVNEEGKAKPQSSGSWLWWTAGGLAGGALVGGLIGWGFGHPLVGAMIGAGILGLVGLLFGP